MFSEAVVSLFSSSCFAGRVTTKMWRFIVTASLLATETLKTYNNSWVHFFVPQSTESCPEWRVSMFNVFHSQWILTPVRLKKFQQIIWQTERTVIDDCVYTILFMSLHLYCIIPYIYIMRTFSIMWKPLWKWCEKKLLDLQKKNFKHF